MPFLHAGRVAGIIILSSFNLGGLVPAQAASAAPPLASHQAIYDLTLGETRGSSSINAIRGRIVYSFSGTACEGYALQFRQVTEINTDSGANVSDLRSATFEDDAGKTFRFNSQNFLNEKLDLAIDGQAARAETGAVSVDLKKPAEKTFEIPQGVLFPTAQIKAIVDAAMNGSSVFESQVYDGSDGGDKFYNTLAVIGKPIDPSKPREGAIEARKELADVARWPVTISYFDPTKVTVGEQTPVYSVTFELYANGISSAVKLDYGDFTLTGEMSSLELLPQTPCP
jgi:hypothetical protein